jgi:hypothetical protein
MNIIDIAKAKQYLLKEQQVEVNEVTFQSGQADEASRSRIYSQASSALGDWMDDYYFEDDDSDETKKNKTTKFVSQINKKAEITYKATYKSRTYSIAIFEGDRKSNALLLLDTSKNNPEDMVVGLIKFSEDIFAGGQAKFKGDFGIKAYVVSWSNLVEELKGTGAGKIIYTALYKYATDNGYGLASDEILYEGSAGMWIKYMPTIASNFGIVLYLAQIIIPLDKEQVTQTFENRDDIFGDYGGVARFIALENPPQIMRKVANNVKGLSWIKGEIIYCRLYESSKKEVKRGTGLTFFDFVDEPDIKSISDLMNALSGKAKNLEPASEEDNRKDSDEDYYTDEYPLENEIEEIRNDHPGGKDLKNVKVAIFRFKDGIYLVKTVGDRLVWVAI